MKNNNIYFPATLRGLTKFDPQYIEQELEEYKNNPCIEALPAIFSDEDIRDKFSVYPSINHEERDNRTNVRYHMIKRLKGFIQPLDNHFRIEHMVSWMIRRGYTTRNMCSKEYIIRLNYLTDIKDFVYKNKSINSEEVCRVLANKFMEFPATQRSAAETTSIIGFSGMGKTTAIERLFLMYPQVIVHNEYMNKPLTRTQIVWLKIDSPYDGSLKTLCKMFFKAIDDVLLTTDYFKRFGENSNSSTATMMIHMAHLVSLYSIGILAIDEMQHLIKPKNDYIEVINFLVTLVNTIGVPIIQVGTPKAIEMLEKGAREVRRAEEAGCIYWDRMSKGREWEFFVEKMWQYQWLREPTPISDEIKRVLYDLTQGVTAFTVNLFMLAQIEAMFYQTEKITVKLIERVAKSDLRMMTKLTTALKNNDFNALAKYDDVVLHIDGVLLMKSEKMNEMKRIKELSQQKKRLQQQTESNFREQITSEIIAMGIFKYLNFTKVDEIVFNSIKQNNAERDKYRIKQVAIEAALIEEKKEESKRKERCE